MCACTTHMPTLRMLKPVEDTLSGNMLTQLTSSGEDIPTEPVSSGEPPTNGSKTCACSDGETKGKDCRLKTMKCT